MKAYLISFTIENPLRVLDFERLTLLVYANSYEEACIKIEANYGQCEYFENLTIE